LQYQVELGAPGSLREAAGLLQSRDLASSERAGALGAAGRAIYEALYPGVDISFSGVNPPLNHPYARILREAGRGNYVSPPLGSRDFLEYVLPFLAYYDGEIPRTALRNVLGHLDQAAQLNPRSVLVPLFRGLALEKTGDAPQAEAAYRQALDISAACYPAELGLIRLLILQGADESLSRLQDLSRRYPGSREMKRLLIRLYADRQDWPGAEGVIAEMLRQNSRDGEILLLRARILLDRGLFQQAQVALDTYASIDTGSREYIFLRARIQAEAHRNREAALNYLRSLIRSYPEDAEIALYMARLLLESPRPEENAEGRTILNRLLGDPSPEALALAVENSIGQENWKDAKAYSDKLLVQRKNNRDLFNACRIERALGNYAAALSHARELYNRDPSSEEAVSSYITALTETGRQSEASRIIDQRLAAVPGGVQKSRYYYLRSKLRTNEDALMNDLRSSLFEDPLNLDALIAMFEIYHRRKDERRAAYYLRQALAIAPNNPQLKRYEAEYRSALGP
jgi:tetratricopeptide (TPR) repeat protein